MKGEHAEQGKEKKDHSESNWRRRREGEEEEDDDDEKWIMSENTQEKLGRQIWET